jgi:hypothetical protein
MSGPSVLFIDGFSRAMLIDVRTYPTRSVEEPDVEIPLDEYRSYNRSKRSGKETAK